MIQIDCYVIVYRVFCLSMNKTQAREVCLPNSSNKVNILCQRGLPFETPFWDGWPLRVWGEKWQGH